MVCGIAVIPAAFFLFEHMIYVTSERQVEDLR